MKHHYIVISLLLLISIQWQTPIYPKEQDTGKTAEKFYQNKQYQNAQKLYKTQLKQNTTNPNILYNLGNTYYHENKLGFAILYYLKAQSITPRDPDIRHNLKIAKSKIIDTITPNTTPYTLLKNVARYATLYEYIVILLMCITVLNSILFLKKRDLHPMLLRAALVFFTALIMGTALLTSIHFYTHYMTERIVIIQSKVELKEGPSQSLETTLLLHEGVQATILKQNDTWSFIRCDNNITGWLPKSSFLSI